MQLCCFEGRANANANHSFEFFIQWENHSLVCLGTWSACGNCPNHWVERKGVQEGEREHEMLGHRYVESIFYSCLVVVVVVVRLTRF